MIRLCKAAMVAPTIVLIKREKLLEFIYFSSACFTSERVMRVEEGLKQPEPLLLEPARLPIWLNYMVGHSANHSARLFCFSKINKLTTNFIMFDALLSSEEYVYLLLI